MSLSAREWREVRRIARRKLGHDELRPGQRQALQAVLEGRDTLAVLPTGSGKSAIYQIAALMIPGPTIVVSPLIALQRDQVDAIEEHELGNAAVVNSSLRASERREAFELLDEEDLEFLLLAPEQLGNAETFERVRAAKPSLFVVDEAHCISEWGHDFRPDYLKLGGLIEALGRPRILALTATAAPEVRDEIIARLGLCDPAVVVTGFDRPNIHLEVKRAAGEHEKLAALLEAVESHTKPGLVYAATRRHAEELAAAIQGRGVRAAAYHAGLKRDEREQRQSAFMNDELEVIVATSAFGMGIDKPDVRFVFHYDLSDSLDAYYQEIGRGGRDGERADAVLFYAPEDVAIRRFLASSGKLPREDVELVAHVVARADGPIAPRQLKASAGLSVAKLQRALMHLEEAGVIQALPTGEVVPADDPPEIGPVAEHAERAHEARREAEQKRVELMRIYAELQSCRRAYLLAHFGEQYEPPCRSCDLCENSPLRPPPRPAEERAEAQHAGAPATGSDPFPLSARVTHPSLGAGTVIDYEGERRTRVVVAFDNGGHRRFSVDVVRREGVLELASGG